MYEVHKSKNEKVLFFEIISKGFVELLLEFEITCLEEILNSEIIDPIFDDENMKKYLVYNISLLMEDNILDHAISKQFEEYNTFFY